MSNELTLVQEPRRESSQERLMKMLQEKHPGYHPIVAMVDLAKKMQDDETGDPSVELACHREVAKYVVQVDRFVEVKSEVRKTQRVVVELFGGPDQSKPPTVLEAEEITRTDRSTVQLSMSGPEDETIQATSYDPKRSLMDVWGSR